MSKPFALQPLVDLAHQQNEASTRAFGLLNQKQQDAQHKLDTLQQYRKDYQLRLQQAVQDGMNQTNLHNFQNFIHRLDEAIAQQRTMLEHARRSAQAGRSDLQHSQRKMKSFDTLAQRHADNERIREAKLEQRQSDEYSGRFAAMKTTQHAD